MEKIKLIFFLLVCLLLVNGCGEVNSKTQCLPGGLNWSEADAKGVQSDMETMMPEYNWTYSIDGNCLTLKKEVE